MPEENEKTAGVRGVSLVCKGRRTIEERICGKDEFWAWSGREKEWWMVTVMMKDKSAHVCNAYFSYKLTSSPITILIKFHLQQ